jgi:penicillin G amidase
MTSQATVSINPSNKGFDLFILLLFSCMTNLYRAGIFFLIPLLLLGNACVRKAKNELVVSGLRESVEVIRDSVGINHIYAKNQHDLFFAQGYCAAKDRLFQFEIWRRQATGTVAEIFGDQELKRDVGTRLFQFRGNMQTEMNHYHPQGAEIITAYVAGVNAFIDEALKSPEALPIEFKILGIKPGKWTPEVVISRHQGLLGNITYELDYGRAVAKAGVEKVKQIMWFHPQDPIITLDPSITSELLEQDIIQLYHAYRDPVKFTTDQVAEPYRSMEQTASVSQLENKLAIDWSSSGSNNWVVNGELTESGFPIMANDPHRRIAIPSLRYMVHLVAPGWNVIGGGEPEIPGVSIGHNEHGAWGLTVFETDGEDLYVYDLNPENLNQYKYQNKWENFTIINDTIQVKNRAPVYVELRYSRHGPVTFIDSLRKKAFAVRCAWMEPGGAPYLASLRMNQAKNWEEFRDACKYSHIPGENMVWADKDGNIGWQAVGIAPIRKNFSGLVPVPGDGRYEWDGYLPILEKPNSFNPPEHFIKTANENVTPATYTHWNAIGYEWSDPYRGERIKEVLSQPKKFSMKEMQQLQTDYVSLPARQLVRYLSSITFESALTKDAQEKLLSWDHTLSSNSIAAGIYVAWEEELKKAAKNKFVPANIRKNVHIQMYRLLQWMEKPGLVFQKDAIENRDAFLKEAFTKAVQSLSERLGSNISNWQYGQEAYKHSQIQHALSHVVNDSLKQILNTPLAPRGGYSHTVGATGSSLNQSSGASFRMIVDVGNWDNSIGTNPPGQSGNPANPFYKNLFNEWSRDEFFPVYYSKEKITINTWDMITLKPK